jgi:hypothetical protein
MASVMIELKVGLVQALAVWELVACLVLARRM